MYYVYLHKYLDGTVFYVGKGKNKRAWSRHSRTKFWYNATRNRAWSVEIVEKDLQEWYALELESNLIHLYGLRTHNDGPLVNLVHSSLCKEKFDITDETRQKLRETHSGIGNGNAIKQEFTFFNVRSGETFKGPPFLFEEKYGLRALDIVHNRVSTLRGWYVVEHGRPRSLPADFSIYLFKHGTTGHEFEGTRQEFKKATGCNVKNLFSGRGTGEKSWGVVRKIRGPLYHTAA